MAQSAPNRRLDSWKEIAAYLKRDERTVQRWEREHGLPVHHVAGRGRGSVFAYAEEIDAWLSRQPSESSATYQDGPNKAAARPLRRRLPRASVWVVAALALALVAVAVVALLSRAAAEVDHLTFAGRVVEARDARGRVLWEYEWPAPHSLLVPGQNATIKRPYWVADLDGDARADVLALAARADSENNGAALYCWSADGRLLWRYEPQETLRFAGRQFEAPWVIHDVHVQGEGKARSVWLALVNPPWWPSYVVRLDAQGRAETHFVNSGAIWVLNSISSPGATYLLAGGFNNEYDGGFLAVLNVEEPAGASPQGAESPFRCLTCPPGKPLRYYVFPRTEVNQLQEEYLTNQVFEIRKTELRVAVSTSELHSGARAIYEFSADPGMEPLVASLSDDFRERHNRLENAGRVHHPFEKCPDATRSLKARMWTPEAGWAEIVFPANATRVSRPAPGL